MGDLAETQMRNWESDHAKFVRAIAIVGLDYKREPLAIPPQHISQ